jgi:branched-chain amino acid transport system permease protein
VVARWDRLPTIIRQLVAPLTALYAAIWVLTRNNRPPNGILLFGVVIGLLYALGAFGIILVYRANRIINFANAEIGSAAAVLAVLLIKSRFDIPYVPALLLALVVGAASGFLVEVLIVRRFAKAPRLILSVVTIFVALPFAAIQFYLPQWVSGSIVDPAPPNTPFSGFEATISGFVFNANALAVVVAAGLVLGGLTAFFKYTDVGIAVRASAENADRAALLGIPVKRVSTIVWALAGALAALSVFLRAPVVGLPILVPIGPSLLIYWLSAAVIARMESFSVALVAGIALGVADQAIFYFSSDPSLSAALALPVLLVALLTQRRRTARALDTGIATWAQSQEHRPIPPELRHLPEIQWGRLAVQMLCVGFAVFGTFLFSARLQNLASIVVIYAIVGVSMVILTGWAGQISLGQWGFAGIGAAVGAGMSSHLNADFIVCLVAAGLAGAVAAVIIGLPALRIQGLYLAVTTLAFALAVQVYVVNLKYMEWLLPSRTEGVAKPMLYGRFDLDNDRNFYWFSLVVLALALASARSLRNSRAGRTMIAARDNQRGAQSYGVSIWRARLTAFAFSGFWAALAGGLFAFHQGAIDAQAYDSRQSILMLQLTVVGGLTSLPGAVLGAVGLKGVEYYLAGSGARLLASGIGVLALLLVFPGGLSQILYGTRDRLLRFVARRRGVVVPSLTADVRVEVEGVGEISIPSGEPPESAVTHAEEAVEAAEGAEAVEAKA